MKALGADELRNLYLNYFAEKGHQILPSASLVPAQDPTLLLTSAGMVPFKPYFLGLQTPPHPRITTCQRCVRTGDIDNVGRTDRHHTFFEMLGNFSFGDYFKREAIHYAWEFVTQRLEIDPDKLWATIYLDDDESFDIWHREIGLPADRIVRLGREDNFWEIGVGPCGPCSEIHYDRGEEYGCGRPECAPGCDECERYLEFWNLVFIQFHQDENGNLTPLKAKGVDTGMGLERTAALLQGATSNFEIDLIKPILDRVAQIAGKTYGQDPDVDVSLRVITDHIRAVTFMVLDGIVPGNEGRSYVLRRLLRRSVRHGRLLGIEGYFLSDLALDVVQLMQGAYPELASSKERITRVIAQEEKRFHETLDQGIDMLEKFAAALQRDGKKVLSGTDAFRLYDTYGFPIELTEEILASHGLTLDHEGFEAAMAAQKERARAARGEKGYLGAETEVFQDIEADIDETQFVGYDTLTTQAQVVAITRGGARVEAAQSGDQVDVFLDQTPFYAEGGGQVADTGTLTGTGGRMIVDDVRKVSRGLVVHRGRIESGTLRVGDTVEAVVDREDRIATARNHTATHLLHQALKDVLGDHANQAGSLVAPDRLRFDLTHFQPIGKDELSQIERLVNEKILANLPVQAVVTGYQDAIEAGAMALFGEKYGDQVRMVTIGDYSKELCGGTHVRSSAEIGFFKITMESGVAAGIRRIEAVTGQGAADFVKMQEAALANTASLLQTSPLEAPDQVAKLINQMKEMERELTRLKARLATAQADRLTQESIEVDGVKIVVSKIDGLDSEALRSLGDRIVSELGNVAVVLGTAVNGRAQMIAMVSDEAQSRGLNAKEILRSAASLISGGGGGNARMAQAGGKDPKRLVDALNQAKQQIVGRLDA